MKTKPALRQYSLLFLKPGQSLLIILLIMAVGLTIGLSVVSRSVTDTRISRQEEESARAFSVAEAGIEKALQGDFESGELGGVNYSIDTELQGGSRLFNFGGENFSAGDPQSVWLVSLDENGDPDPEGVIYDGSVLNFYWGDLNWNGAEELTPALEVSLIYSDAGSFKIKKEGFDPLGSRTSTNGLTLASDSCEDYHYCYEDFSLPVGAIPYLLRLKLLYNDEDHPLAVEAQAGETLPAQGNCYVSTAVVPGSNITRRVRQCQFYQAPPAMLDYVLYSEGSFGR